MVIVSRGADMMTIEQEEEQEEEEKAEEETHHISTERIRLENNVYTGGGSFTRSLLSWLNSPL